MVSQLERMSVAHDTIVVSKQEGGTLRAKLWLVSSSESQTLDIMHMLSITLLTPTIRGPPQPWLFSDEAPTSRVGRL